MSIYNFLTTDNLINLLTNVSPSNSTSNDRVIHNNIPINYNDNMEYYNLVEYVRASERFYSENNIRYNMDEIMDELNFAYLSVYSEIVESDFDNFLNDTFDYNLETTINNTYSISSTDNKKLKKYIDDLLSNNPQEKFKLCLQRLGCGGYPTIECSICQSYDSENLKTVKLRCGHIFHHECLSEMINFSDICPNCREKIL